VRLWDVGSGRELTCFHGHEDGVFSVSFSPDGCRLASGSDDKSVRLWDVSSGRELTCFHGHEDGVFSVSFSPDGRRLASASRDYTVRLWDAESGQEVACLRGHEFWVNSVVFAPDGRRLASASGDDTVRLWDPASGQEVACLVGHEDSVLGVSFSPDGRRLASASRDGTVRLWDAETCVCLDVAEYHGRLVSPPAGVDWYPWRILARPLQTVIEDAGSGEALAWFPEALDPMATCPAGGMSAGPPGQTQGGGSDPCRLIVGAAADGNVLYFLRLEGDVRA
jgi:WD40 repeat protein